MGRTPKPNKVFIVPKTDKDFLINAYEKEIRGYERGVKMCEDRIGYLNVKIYEVNKKIRNLNEGNYA